MPCRIEDPRAAPGAYRGAQERRETTAPTVTAWLDGLLATGRGNTVLRWKEAAVETSAAAIAKYLRVRGDGPSVVPIEVL